MEKEISKIKKENKYALSNQDIGNLSLNGTFNSTKKEDLERENDAGDNFTPESNSDSQKKQD